ncbi:MAG: hypothetical protein HUU46_12090 [Candidatus Hydrogenedentes bacterium]|nr:hypothetical protein [Candidatus Hydrogenedentota bacterium]
MEKQLTAVQRIVVATCVLVIVATLPGCPLANGFFVRIENKAADIAVTVVKLRDFDAQENVGGNVLLIPVQPGHTQLNFVSMDRVGSADAVKVRVEGTNPQQPIGFAVTRVIDGGFEAGKTVVVTVEGSPTQSVDIEIEPS